MPARIVPIRYGRANDTNLTNPSEWMNFPFIRADGYEWDRATGQFGNSIIARLNIFAILETFFPPQRGVDPEAILR